MSSKKFKSTKQTFYRCCNPFLFLNHNKKQSLRKVSKKALESCGLMRKDDLICSVCRKKLDVILKMDLASSALPMEVCHSPDTSVDQDNDYIYGLDLQLKDFLQSDNPYDLIESLPAKLIIDSLKYFEHVIDILNHYCSKQQKIQILTLFPTSMSSSDIKSYINVSEYSINLSRKLVKDKGVLALPEPKRGKNLSEVLISFTVDFFNRDDISSPRPGTKDVVVVKQSNGTKVKLPKRLLLWNLREAYELLKLDLQAANINSHIGLTKFTLLRPKNVLLVGATGTHTVCLCAVHQNVKLLIAGSHIAALTKGERVTIESYQNCYIFLICEHPTEDCYFLSCDKCPGKQPLIDYLIEIMEKNEVSEVLVKQWLTDSSNKTVLETVAYDYDLFISHFADKLQNLLAHAFIAEQQSKFSREIASGLTDGEYQVIADFAENYSFVVQDAIQGFHWNNDQATIYNVVIYYKENGKVHHCSLVIISENRKHDSVAVYTYHKLVIEFLKQKFHSVKKIFYFSDGAPQQYKNYKNVINLVYHKQDFGVSAEWHFFPTAHGKGPCDGLGASVKRGARNASLQAPVQNQIISCDDLFKWLSTTDRFPHVTFRYSSTKDYDRNVKFLDSRFKNTRRIQHLQEQHCLIPLDNGFVRAKRFSYSNTFKDEKIL